MIILERVSSCYIATTFFQRFGLNLPAAARLERRRGQK